MPGKDLVLSDHDVGMPITGKVQKLQIGIVPVDVGQGIKRSKALPVLIRSALIKARHRTAQFDQVELAVTG